MLRAKSLRRVLTKNQIFERFDVLPYRLYLDRRNHLIAPCCCVLEAKGRGGAKGIQNMTKTVNGWKTAYYEDEVERLYRRYSCRYCHECGAPLYRCRVEEVTAANRIVKIEKVKRLLRLKRERDDFEKKYSGVPEWCPFCRVFKFYYSHGCQPMNKDAINTACDKRKGLTNSRKYAKFIYPSSRIKRRPEESPGSPAKVRSRKQGKPLEGDGMSPFSPGVLQRIRETRLQESGDLAAQKGQP